MNVLILSGNPKKDGLCESVINYAKDGIIEASSIYKEFRLCDMNLINCKVCSSGWGTCRNDNYCSFDSDGFNEIQTAVLEANAIIIITPVYWWEVSESLKNVMDRLRRCEFNVIMVNYLTNRFY